MQHSQPQLKLIGIVSLLLVALLGCASGFKIRTDYDRAVDFAAIHTFGFPAQSSTDRGGYATLVTSHFKEAIKHEMGARGYVFADNNPDVVVSFYSHAHEKTEVYSYPTAYAYPYMGFRYGPPHYGWYSAWPFYYDDVNVVSYTAGTFKIDVVDAKRQQTIWEASVEERLDEKAQDNPQPNIARLVTEMFRKFPSGATTKS